MSRKKNFIIIGAIFISAFLAGGFIFADILKIPYFPKVPFKLGLDLQGGIHLVYEADFTKTEAGDKKEIMEGLRDIIERRVNFFGVTEPVVQIQGDRLIVELAGVIDPAEAIRQIGQTPFLEFKEQRTEEETQKIIDKQKELEGKTREEIGKVENWQLAFEDSLYKSTLLTGKYLKKAQANFDQSSFSYSVDLEFDGEGAKIFDDLTSKNIGKKLAIYIDNILISDPVVQDRITGGKAVITGSFTAEQAKTLARNLNAGALPVPINLISQQLVGPILGKVSLEESLKAGIVGFLLILLFMIVFYRIPGFFASLSLLLYVIFLLAVFKLISVTLTLAGIAGFLLSIGMTVDANILIFSRMREELKQGKDYLVSLQDGFKRAWPSIRDGNFTTILVGLILFALGTSFVKGFALILILGNLVGMASAIFITNAFLKVFPKGKSTKWLWLWR